MKNQHSVSLRPGGFTLVELMVALAIGLITSLAIAQVLILSEGYKRTATAGSDAQVNGALALYTLQRDIQMAGYGFASNRAALGCPIHAKYGGNDVATGAGTPSFPTVLAPVFIDTTNANQNKIRVLSSSKSTYTIPTRIIAPGYDPAQPSKASFFTVNSTLGVANGDLMLATSTATANCEVFRVSKTPSVVGQIDRTDDAGWNPTGFPAAAYNDGNVLVNLGTLEDSTYSISAGYSLQQTQFLSGSGAAAPSYAAPRDLFSNIVVLRAMYGTAPVGSTVVDTYTQTAPTTNAQWQQVRTLRVALVARSAQYERDEVTTADPLWDVGNMGTVSPAPAACGTSKCLTLTVSTTGTDWKHYRYKVFDTEIPLRNLLWQP